MCRRALIAVAAIGALSDYSYGAGDLPITSGLSNPIFATYAPGDFNHLYVVERGLTSSSSAVIVSVDLTTKTKSTFLTINNVNSTGEQGLLGLAFDPDYSTPGTPGFGKFYVDVTTAATTGNVGVQNIIQYENVAGSSPVVDGTLLSWANTPTTSHKAGWIGFSPQVDPANPGTTIRPNDDHNLYITTGDGSFPTTDAQGNGQSTSTLLAKVLRIHVDPTTASYSIPSSNPFAGSSDQTVKQEIFTYGLRNPFRDSFDRATGNLFIADVGLNNREEVDVQKVTRPSGGENYEWPYREGNIQTPGATGGPLTGLPNETGPILDYDHTTAIDGLSTLIGQCIIGGYVYRGSALPNLYGCYLFADYITGRIFSFRYDSITGVVSGLADQTNALLGGPQHVVSFGEDAAGELYVLTTNDTSGSLESNNGALFKIVTNVPEPASALTLLAGSALLLKRRRKTP